MVQMSATSVRSREESRFLALLARTQQRASSNLDQDWRFTEYVETLQKWLEDLQNHPQGPTKELLTEYKTKVHFLQKILESKTALANSSDNTAPDTGDFPDGRRRSSRRSSSPPNVSSLMGLPHGPASTGDTLTKEIHQKTTERHHSQMRQALLGNDSDLRKRKNNDDSPDGEDDLDYLMRAHHLAQEQVAEEMLSLTRNLKEQSMAAKEIIRKDTATMERANDLVDKNSAKLKTETDRLQEHTKFSCRCWIWLLLLVVFVTFIAMVWVMKFFRKRKDM